jgi:predicted enzyme related to lactoylglutathione lyase
LNFLDFFEIPMAHSFVWVDIPCLDLDRAIRFYSAVIGREVKREEFPGFSIGVFAHGGTDVGACLFVKPDSPPSDHGPLLYLNCDGRLDAAVESVVKNGGKVLQAKHPIGPHGYRAIILDSEGNRLALHST